MLTAQKMGPTYISQNNNIKWTSLLFMLGAKAELTIVVVVNNGFDGLK